MHVKLIGVLATLAALGAAAPYGGRQETLSTQIISLLSHDAQKSFFSPARPLVEQPATKTNDQGICWRVCFPEEPKCPEGWVSFVTFAQCEVRTDMYSHRNRRAWAVGVAGLAVLKGRRKQWSNPQQRLFKAFRSRAIDLFFFRHHGSPIVPQEL